ncbi:hypothetical protein SAMN05660206_101258 [Sphingobacterium wenxiniae]|uniref:Uncharacterized protein n=1 Tax=Sphingobacterium wenxiniae TaxID=683125 RepID=A0A1I6P341_9SPHI|nr:hypothetical protein SAMN05660206_101258 [Sphingobacterium wenxiniae]
MTWIHEMLMYCCESENTFFSGKSKDNKKTQFHLCEIASLWLNYLFNPTYFSHHTLV